MKQYLIKFTLLAGYLWFSTIAQSAEETESPPLSAAILDFKEATPELSGVGASVSALLQTRLSVESSAVLVERAELNEIFSEQELTLSNVVTPGQAARVGQLTGAEVLVSGRVFSDQNQVHIVAKVISSSSSRVFGATSSYDVGGKIDGAVESLSKDLAKLLDEKKADLRGKESLEEKVAAQMKTLMDGRKGGKIYIHLPETILQVIVPDPAAQTEVGRTFQHAGWTVTETESEADLTVKGEAFAETGIRRGNLWFTRSRLELTMRDHGGKVVKTDRVVCGNVDLAQAVSAKGALQKAGLLAAPVALKAWLDSITPHAPLEK